MLAHLKRACTETAARLWHDGDFRASAGIYLGMTGNFAYALLRAALGLRSASAWLLSSAVYFGMLGLLRARLARVYCRPDGRGRTPIAYRCYHQTAQLLFVLILPMGGMILQLLLSNPAHPYPWHTIYAAAAYTFCMLALSLIKLLKHRRQDSPVLAAAQALRLAAALMSLLGLQNALITQFSPGNSHYRTHMNLLTGTGVYLAVVIIAVCMLVRSARMKKELNADEQG